MKKETMDKVTFRLPISKIKQIEELSEQKKRKKTEFVRLIVEDYLDKINL